MKKAIIFGITGQTGSYLAKLLLKKNYKIYGIRRQTSVFPNDTYRLEKLIKNFVNQKKIILKYGDITDSVATRNLIEEIKPDEIYNLAAQSHVKVSFDLPKYTSDVNMLGLINILESIRSLKKKIKLYQASTSEMFGNANLYKSINEKSIMHPVSPYAAGKLFSYHMVKIYREAYNLYATNGILFNHESPLRSEQFVTKKITKGICNVLSKKIKKFYLGNLNSKRDWGHAEDYALAIWKMMQLKKPQDLVISTGNTYSVRKFIKLCFDYLNIKIKFVGKGLNEKVIDDKGKVWIEINKKLFRPVELNHLNGSSYKARNLLKWRPKYNMKKLIEDMMSYDLKENKLK